MTKLTPHRSAYGLDTADWTPLDPRWRQRIAPTHYATRALHAGSDQPTGVHTLEIPR